MQQDVGDQNPTGAGQPTETGLTPNLAGALSYVLGWVTGLIIVLIQKDSYSRFHGYQSILLSVAWVVLWVALSILSGILGRIPVINILAFLIGLLISVVLGLGGFVLWIVLIVKAAQGSRFKLPYIGDMAEKYAGS
jgi:uncharacterized membrane protein